MKSLLLYSSWSGWEFQQLTSGLEQQLLPLDPFFYFHNAFHGSFRFILRWYFDWYCKNADLWKSQANKILRTMADFSTFVVIGIFVVAVIKWNWNQRIGYKEPGSRNQEPWTRTRLFWEEKGYKKGYPVIVCKFISILCTNLLPTFWNTSYFYL